MKSTEKKRILIVDNSPMWITYLVHLLRDDYELFVAINGTVAIKVAEDEVPHLIFLDVNMPDMSGYEVCEHLKAIDKTKNIPIIFFTATDTEEDMGIGKQLGAVGYLQKNVAQDVVKEKVREYFEKIDQ